MEVDSMKEVGRDDYEAMFVVVADLVVLSEKDQASSSKIIVRAEIS